ncbi:Coq4 family protein [Citromicrobium bathyomarinum]|uniref:Coq4 family protein n=1 Tax=Citromicrobium bathyomarinum TaxID=72174 RepID=UPI00315B27FB
MTQAAAIYGSTGSRLSTIPFSHPDRVPAQRNIRRAWHHFWEFKKDKEKTSEVFRFFEHLPWLDMPERVRNFLSTDHGKYVFETEPFLPDILDDHEMLRREYPAGSLAHEYCDYMEREGLSAAGLVAEYDDFRGERPRLDDQIEWYADRLRDTHDLLHLLTTIGRDTLGEQALGAFVFKQRPSHGHLILGYAGAAVIKANVKTKAPVMRAIHDCKQAGKACEPIAEQSIRELLAMTIDEARAFLNIQPVAWYQKCQSIWAEEGIDPLKILANDAKASIYRKDTVPSPDELSRGPSVFAMDDKSASENAPGEDAETPRERA